MHTHAKHTMFIVFALHAAHGFPSRPRAQSGHTAAVYVAKFSPRDSLVASAGFDRTLRLWEGNYPYSQVACLKEHRQPISDLCWAPDGRSLISASFDQVSSAFGGRGGEGRGEGRGIGGLFTGKRWRGWRVLILVLAPTFCMLTRKFPLCAFVVCFVFM